MRTPNNAKVQGKTKEQFVSEFCSLPSTELAEKLFNAKYENHEARLSLRDAECERKKADSRSEEANRKLAVVLGVNKNLARVLELNGVHPTKLIVSYFFDDCAACDHSWTDVTGEIYCESEDDYPKCPQAKRTETVFLYDYSVDGELTGINHKFEEVQIEVESVKDASTGCVIWSQEIVESDSRRPKNG